jgi:DNA adenine methylase
MSVAKTAPINQPAKPFLKWAGGKRKLCDFLTESSPANWNRYFEPMMGGAAMFFHLQPKQAFLSDSNPELVNAYKVLRDSVEPLIEELEKHQDSEEYYYRIRELDRSNDFLKLGNVVRASRLIYLNKTCFNGLFRVNSKGHFNVPYGKYENKFSVAKEDLRSSSAALQNTEISLGNFQTIEEQVEKDDFVYFDPPYLPISKTSSFTSYTREPFGINEQVELRNFCEKLSAKGAKVMVSNSNNEFIRGLYADFNLREVLAARAINSKSTKRGKILELVATNY